MDRADGERAIAERLVRKYEALLALHRALAAWDDAAAKEADRALAAEFPGALRELQTLDEETLGARLADAEEAARTGALAPWMRWLDEHHRLYAMALALRRRLGRTAARRTLDDAEAARLADELSAATGWPVDAALVRAIARPPNGRIGDVLLAAIARRHDTTPAEIARALFPRRRRRHDGD